MPVRTRSLLDWTWIGTDNRVKANLFATNNSTHHRLFPFLILLHYIVHRTSLFPSRLSVDQFRLFLPPIQTYCFPLSSFFFPFPLMKWRVSPHIYNHIISQTSFPRLHLHPHLTSSSTPPPLHTLHANF